MSSWEQQGLFGNSQRIVEALDRLFGEENQRIVFWHDPAREFCDVVANLALPGIELIPVDQAGSLCTKVRVERAEPSRRFLVYSAEEEPDYESDWLLDVRLYARSFRADRASIILDELGLQSQQLRQHVAARRKFFDNKERLQKLRILVSPSDNAEDLDRKMLAVILKAEQPELFEVVRSLFHSYLSGEGDDADVRLEEPPPGWNQVEKYDLAGAFWEFMAHSFGYQEDSPTVRNLLIRLMVTDFGYHLSDALPKSVEHLLLPQPGRSNAVVCLAQWRDSASRGISYDLLANEVARILHLEDLLYKLDLEPLINVPTFSEVEKAVIRGLRDRVLENEETLDANQVRAVAAQRQGGHWASITIPSSPAVPRQAFARVYQALTAAAGFLELRNQNRQGFSFATPADAFRRYSDDLFRFDQLYRQFWEVADEVEAQAWDVLKKLGDRIEDVCVNWFQTNLALAWGKLLDPAGNPGLLNYWKIEGAVRQDEFYDHFVRPKLDEAQRRRVYVIVSDALRYEAAEELTQLLNGQYRFEAELGCMLGVLPSFTALGMASLLPHQTLSIDKSGAVLVDGRSTAGLEQRNAVLEPVGGMACKADDLIAKRKDEGRAMVSDRRIVYIFHNAIDVVGESPSEARTLSAVRKAIEELAALVTYVINNLNGHYVLVTADHGFLFSFTHPDETLKSPISDKPAGTVKAKRRYLLGYSLPERESAWRGKTSTTAGATGEMEFWIPRGANRFHFMGSQLFVHGGAMPQEVVVPVVTVRHIKGKTVGQTKTKSVSVQVLGANHKITTTQHRFELLQMEAVGERVKPVTLKVAVYEAGQAVTNIETVTFDSSSPNMDERKKAVRLVLENREYNKKTPYRLVLRDAETGIEQSSMEVIIDRAFTDDF